MPNFEGNRGAKTILRNREHIKTNLLFLGNRGASQLISGEQGNRYPHDHLNTTIQIAVDLDIKPQTKQTNIANFFPRSQALTALFMLKIKLDNAILYSKCHLYGKQCAP